jgi:hypothetical protein
VSSAFAVPVERRPLVELPATLGDYVQVGRVDVPASQMKILQPTDHWAGTFRSPQGVQLLLLLMYWDPQEADMGAHVSRPHSPDYCFPTWGWQLVKKVEGRYPARLPDGQDIRTRLYRKSDQIKVLVYWSQGLGEMWDAIAEGSLGRRLGYLADSWRRRGLVISNHYSVVITIDVSTSEKVAEDVAMDFAAVLAPVIADFGFRPNLQDSAPRAPSPPASPPVHR